MDTAHEPVPRPGDSTCVNCGTALERIEENVLDIAGRDVVFLADRCPGCGNEYVNAPEILRPDADLLARFDPASGPIGSVRRIENLMSLDRAFGVPSIPKVAGTLLGYLLQQDLADVVLLAHQGVAEEPVVAYGKDGLVRAGEIRMGAGRAVITGSGLRSNLLTLGQLRRFAEADGGAHPRVAVMGRPCQIYTVNKLRWEAFLPGYELAFALGTFCYGNFTPAGWGGRHLRDLLGFDPSDIRQVDYSGEELVFTSAEGGRVHLAQHDVAGLVNPNCLQCYDFTGSFSDVSVGRVSPDDAFEVAVVRTERGEQVVEQAIKDGALMPASRVYDAAKVVRETDRAAGFLRAMGEIKRELTRRLR